MGSKLNLIAFVVFASSLFMRASDPVIPIARAGSARDRLQSLGYAVQWHEYPMQHSVCPEEIRDIGAWLRRVLAN